MFVGAPAEATLLRQRSSPLRIFILGDPPGLLEWQEAATELSEQEDRRCVCVVVDGWSCLLNISYDTRFCWPITLCR